MKIGDREFIKLTVRNSNGRPYYSIIYLEVDDNGVGHDFEGYSSYSLDVISDYLKKYFMPYAQPEPCEDAVSREVLKDGFTEMCNLICPYTKKQKHVMCGSCLMGTAFDVLEATPSVTPKQRTGKWIHVSEEMWKCDQCGEISCCSPKYCPDCGSRNEVTT